MKDNGLNNVMELIKIQKWENLFKRREFVFVDAVKEFYAKMIVIHLKKKDAVKSSVKGVAIEFDHDKLASILGVPGKNGICEYIKDVWEESKYTKPLEITRRFANDETLMAARRGESGSDDQFFYAQVDLKEPVTEPQAAPAVPVPSTVQQKETTPSGVDPLCPTGRIPEAVMNKMQAEFERARANRFQADLEKAQADNARLLALLHQAQSKPKTLGFPLQTIDQTNVVYLACLRYNLILLTTALNIFITHSAILYHIIIDAT
ncbi:hypothetical protein Dimus_025085 [Dionaea muscipula]